jgi:hypothetical protein
VTQITGACDSRPLLSSPPSAIHNLQTYGGGPEISLPRRAFSLGGLAIQGIARCAPAERNAADWVKGQQQRSARMLLHVNSRARVSARRLSGDKCGRGKTPELTATAALDVIGGGTLNSYPRFLIEMGLLLKSTQCSMVLRCTRPCCPAFAFKWNAPGIGVG